MIKPTGAASPAQYIEQIDEPRRTDIQTLYALITKALPRLEPYMLSGMIAWGRYRYKYASGREGDWCMVALASQKNYISMYVCASDQNGYVAEQRKAEFPKANIGKSCIRFKRVEDVDLKALEKLVKESVKLMTANARAAAKA